MFTLSSNGITLTFPEPKFIVKGDAAKVYLFVGVKKSQDSDSRGHTCHTARSVRGKATRHL